MTFQKLGTNMLQIKNLSFAYQDKKVLDTINFSVKNGSHLSIIGESGCGKSTLLKAIYGLFDIEQGTIFFANEKVTGPAKNLVPGHPKMKYLAQDFGLMPYITVAENVGKFLSNLDLKKKKTRINELLQMVDMLDFANTKPLNLSGGQQQRVALAMSLAKEPQVLLLDEPFSQIDTFHKNFLRRNLFSYLKNKGITCLVATHDVTDALAFSDQILVLKDGRIQQLAPTEKLYNEPANRYVASLFDEINLIGHNGKEKILFPHQISIIDKSNWQAQVVQSYFQGGFYRIACQSNGNTLFVNYNKSLPVGKIIYLKEIKKNIF